MINILRYLKEHPIWAAAWTLFTISLSFVISYEYQRDDRILEFQNLKLEYQNMSKELKQALFMDSLYYTTLQNAYSNIKSTNKKHLNIEPTDYLKDSVYFQLLASFINDRKYIAVNQALIGNLVFNQQAFKELSTILVNDFEKLDSYLEKRTVIIVNLRLDIDKANKDRVSLLTDAQEYGDMTELSIRQEMIDQVIKDQADNIKILISKLQTEKKKANQLSNVFIGASAYIAGLIGAFLAFFRRYIAGLIKRNKKKKVLPF